PRLGAARHQPAVIVELLQLTCFNGHRFSPRVSYSRFALMPSIRSPRGRLSLLVLLALAVGAWLLRDLPKSFNSPQPEGAWRQCIRVVDGDTLLLDGDQRIRL